MTFFRIIRIFRLLSKNGILILVSKKLNSRIFIFISFLFSPIGSLIKLSKNISELSKSINLLLVDLGPIFIKFGQTLSTRPDLIGQEIVDNLKNLQDKIDPFEYDVVESTIQHELRCNIDDIFDKFSKIPVASASIAQVHSAILKTGEKVAVKILRPEIEKKYLKDINLLKVFAKLLSLLSRKSRRLKPIEVVNIFKKTMFSEINLTREAASCSELGCNLKNDNEVVIPKIYWDYTTERVLTASWIDGVSVYNDDLEKNSLNKKELSKNLAVTFFNQAFRDGFFHADLHPGNILVTESGKIALVDFGIMGRLSERDRVGIAEILHAFLKKDYKKVAEIHVKLGYVPKDCDVMEFSLACRSVAEPIFNKPNSHISIGKLLARLFTITEEFGMQTQPQLLMLQKTMVVVEGIGKELYGSVNMWELAEPWIEEWSKINISFDAKIIKFIKNLIMKINSEILQ